VKGGEGQVTSRKYLTLVFMSTATKATIGINTGNEKMKFKTNK
jgi:hypothetical protein